MKKELIILSLILILVFSAHTINLFHFPYYEDDEGTYMSQAWSVVTQGKLAPYTYFYDHAPLGWIFISLWTRLTGGFLTFGASINSGRVFMIILQLVSAVFVYFISKKLTNNSTASYFAVLFFSLSPIALFFQRRVLLDNIMVFWLLLSLLLLLRKQNVFSAITFAIAVLTKETAIYMLPVFIYMLYLNNSDKSFYKYFFKWALISLFIISLYPGYALYKGEFFPAGTRFGGNTEHVSLISEINIQLERTGNGGILTKDSSFRKSFNLWIKKDPLIIWMGIISTVWISIWAYKNKFAAILAIAVLIWWTSFIRGGLVLEFYIIPLIPFIALTIAYIAATFDKKYIYVGLSITVAIMVGYLANNLNDGTQSIFLSNQTSAQIKAINWLEKNYYTGQFTAIDNYAYVDLHEKIPGPDTHIEYYFKIDRDPAISNNLLKNNPNNIDIIMITPQVKQDMESQGLSLLAAAFNTSKMVQNFTSDGWDVALYTNQKRQSLTNP